MQPVGVERLSWNSNFFYGNDSEKWCVEVPNFREIYYENLYDGIDLRYYSLENGLKYDLIVHPGADINQIKVRYLGAENLRIDEGGNLIIKTEIKDILDSEPFIYQDYNEARHQVVGRFKIIDELEYGFELLDEYCDQEILIIDPTVRIEYSTFVGGATGEIGYDIEVDSNGSAFVTGVTLSMDFPTTPGVHNTTRNDNGSSVDIFVLKLSPNGSDLIYSTFIGGNRSEYSQGITIDYLGNAYITGDTFSANFPVTFGAFMTNYIQNDAFILKLNETGAMLVYSTFICGIGEEHSEAIVVDSLGNAYITGKTNSTDFPRTSGAFQRNLSKGFDAFVLKLNPVGKSLNFSTYIGGSGIDVSQDLTLDSAGNIFITGSSGSKDFPNTTGAYDIVLNGTNDIFVLKLNASGDKILYSTFVGGNWDEYGECIIIDEQENVIITGRTYSMDFPTTPNAFNTRYNGGTCDIIAFKLNSNASMLLFSTFLGGGFSDYGLDVNLDPEKNIIITGYTHSMDFPVLGDAMDMNYDNEDSYIVILNHNASGLKYSSFIGGNCFDSCFAAGTDPFNNIYLTGLTNSTNFPTTNGAYNTTKAGDYDVFVMKISLQKVIEINSIKMLVNSTPTNIAYSHLCNYTFSVKVEDTANLTDLCGVFLTLDPLGTKIQLIWYREKDKFFKLNDKMEYITLEPSSRAYNDSVTKWTVDFKITFNWTYPDERFNNIEAHATSLTLATDWYNASKFYRVENDLDFIGNLSVKGDNNRRIIENGLVRGGEKLHWTNLTPVYQETTDVYPPADEIDIILWDETDVSCLDSPAEGQPCNFWMYTPLETHLSGYRYIINLTGIPSECDATNVTFVLRIDGEPVVFSDPTPDSKVWQTRNDVTVSIKITDYGGGLVDGTSVMHCVSKDNGNSWYYWMPVYGIDSGVSIIPTDIILLKEGRDNLIKWKARDSVGNGPTESDEFNILVDITEVKFSNPIPLSNSESKDEEVQVGITVSDNTSGVDASSIEYTISTDSGMTWDSWLSVPGLTSGSYVNVTLNLEFPNGTENRIKWRSSDIAGNGPTESMPYKIIVNTWTQPYIPKIKLLAPEDRSIIPSTSVQLSWELLNKALVKIKYDVFLDTMNPPVDNCGNNLTDSKLRVTDLTEGVTYYWTVVPKTVDEVGTCLSGVWSFKVNTSFPYPEVKLIAPEDGSIISSLKVRLSWELYYEGTEDVTYDVYFDTDNDPILLSRNIITTHHILDMNLENGQTYYWTVIPRIEEKMGLCTSGVWSFSINTNVPFPRVELISPENGSIIPTAEPNLFWEVYYDGPEIVTYDIYLDVDDDPDLIKQNIISNQYKPETILAVGETYYWKVVPKAGSVIGPESLIWSFTVGIGSIPYFELNLTLVPSIIRLKPRDQINVKAIVTNLGVQPDNFLLKVEDPYTKKLKIEVREPSSNEVSPQESVVFNLTVIAGDGIEKGELILTVDAISKKALEVGHIVDEEAKLTVIIIEPGTISKERSVSISEWWIILIIIIIILALLIDIAFQLRKRKRQNQEMSRVMDDAEPDEEPEQEPEEDSTLEYSAESVEEPLENDSMQDDAEAESMMDTQALEVGVNNVIAQNKIVYPLATPISSASSSYEPVVSKDIPKAVPVEPSELEGESIISDDAQKF